MSKDLPAVQKAYDLSKEILTRASNFPRDFRFSLGERLIDRSLDILEALVAAAYSREKVRLLDSANLNIEKLRFLLRLSHELGPLSTKGYEYVIVILNELGAQVGGWRKQAAKSHGQDLQKPVP